MHLATAPVLWRTVMERTGKDVQNSRFFGLSQLYITGANVSGKRDDSSRCVLQHRSSLTAHGSQREAPAPAESKGCCSRKERPNRKESAGSCF